MVNNGNVILASQDSCTGCMVCGDACLKGCISYKEGHDGFWYPQINHETCIECHACQRVCPVITPIVPDKGYTPKAYAAWTKKDARHNSASGGVFFSMAEEVINHGGYVSGAIFEGKKVKHILTNNSDDLKLIQGTKYFQSDTSGIYSQIKALLKEGKTVLFGGTSCQVAGLLNYVGKDHKNLVTVDLICYGVPSALTIDVEERIRGKKLKRIISSRDKNHEGGWRNVYYMTCEWTDGTTTVSSPKESFMLGSFCSGKVMRESCYHCSYKTLSRQADFTIGDYHNVKDFDQEKKEGISLVLVHSEKGLAFIRSISELTFHERDIRECLPGKRTIYYNDSIYGTRYTRRFMPFILKKAPVSLLKVLYNYIVKSKNPLMWPITAIDICYAWVNNYKANKRMNQLLDKLG